MAIEPNHRDGHPFDVPNNDVVGEPDSDDGSSDTSSVLTQLGNDEFPSHFIEYEGRLFHSHGELPYPLPVDGEEQARLNNLHNVLRDLVGSHCGGPVADVLASEQGRQKRVLDLCAGTGVWVMDMAGIFTNVKFSGVDIAPIMPRTTPHNAVFEVADVTRPLRWDDGTMDFVHARNVSLAVADYPQLLHEIARVLRPGGLFVSGEVLRQVTFAPGFPGNPDVDAPYAEDLYGVIDNILARRGLHNYVRHIPNYLEENGLFTGGEVRDYIIPIGEGEGYPATARHRQLGQAYLDVMTEFAVSVGAMLRREGLGEMEIQGLVTGFVHDMENVQGLVGVYQTVWMTRA